MKLHFHSRHKWHTFSAKPAALSPAERQRQFLQGVPLVLLPAMFAFPAWALLVHQPRFAHAQVVAGIVFPLFVVMAAIGTRKLARCLNWRDLDLVGAMAFGVLLVLGVMLLFAFVFFLILYRGDPSAV